MIARKSDSSKTPVTTANICLSALAILIGGCASSLAGADGGVSRSPAVIERGRQIARTECSRCHGVGRTDESPNEQAPPFRRIHERYPIEQLAEAFAEGIVVGHAEMPPFELQPDQINALLAYLGSLDRTKRR